jgi:hypothetical protein
MSTPELVAAFYARIWNARESGAAAELLADDFTFRGSLGDELTGREAFSGYARSLHAALADYRCERSAWRRASARSRNSPSGRHAGVLRGRLPTGRRVAWPAAALTLRDERIARLWVRRPVGSTTLGP